MTKTDITIRAPALYRLVGNAQTIRTNEDDAVSFLDHVLGNGISPAIEELAGMAMEMNHGGALAHFPTEDVAVLGEIVLYMIDYYRCHPDLASKIAIMCKSVIKGDGHPLITLPRQSRMLEIAQLNDEFYKLSKEAAGTAHVEFIMQNDMPASFNSESQYIRVVVTV